MRSETVNKTVALALVMSILVSGLSIGLILSDDQDGVAEVREEKEIMAVGGFFDTLSGIYDTVAGISSGICVAIATVNVWEANFWYDLSGTGQSYEREASDADVQAALRDAVLTVVTEDGSTIFITSSYLLDNSTDVWHLATNYTQRASEIAAGQLWSAGQPYDPNTVVASAGVFKLIGNNLYNVYCALDYGTRNTVDRLDTWNGSATYGSVTESLVWNGGATTTVAPGSGATVIPHYATIVNATNDKNVVYFAGADDGYESVWAFQNGTIKTLDGSTTVMSLTAGENDVSELPVGFYQLSAGQYGGLFVKALSDDAATTYGGAVIECNDGSSATYGYVIPYDEDSLTIVYNGTTYTSDYLKYSYSADGETHQTLSVDGVDALAKLLLSVDGQVQMLNTVLDESSQAGRVMWTLSANAGSTNVFLSPSSVSASLVSQGIDANQSYALYINSLAQASEWYQTYGENLSSTDLRVSAESLKLFCYGKIYNSDGSTLAQNVVFTPYVYLKNMGVYTTEYTVFNQDGLIMVWSAENQYASLDDFESAEESATIVMPKGAYCEITDMIYDGEHKTYCDLNVMSVDKITILSDVATENVEAPKVLSATKLCSVILIELAIIIGLVWFAFPFLRPIWLLPVIAVVILAIGVFAPSLVADLLIGVIGQ